MTYNHILLFRGKDSHKLLTTIQTWRKKFADKYWDYNIADYRNQEANDSLLTDLQTPWFMGASRLIILHDILWNLDGDNALWDSSHTSWINALSQMPVTNFCIFIGNPKPISPLEKWLADHATVHQFDELWPADLVSLVAQKLHISSPQARFVCERLNYQQPLITMEIEKLLISWQTSWTQQELVDILPNYSLENNFELLNPLWWRQGKLLNHTWKKIMRTSDRELTMATLTTIVGKTLFASLLPGIHGLPLTPNQIATGQRQIPYRIQLKKLYDALVSADTAEKSGDSPEKLDAFLIALLTYCETSQ